MKQQLKLKSQLITIIQQRSIAKGPIRLASGKISEFYINLKQTLLYPKGLDIISDLILEFLEARTSNLVGVGGAGIGALPITTAVSLKSLKYEKPLLHLHIREQVKTHGTMQLIEGADHFQPDDKIWILEDVVTTGKSSLSAVQKCQDIKLHVEGILTCVDRQEGGQKNIEDTGLQFHSLILKEELGI